GIWRGRGVRPPPPAARSARGSLLLALLGPGLLLRQPALAAADRLEAAVVGTSSAEGVANHLPGMDRGDDALRLLPRLVEGRLECVVVQVVVGTRVEALQLVGEILAQPALGRAVAAPAH